MSNSAVSNTAKAATSLKVPFNKPGLTGFEMPYLQAVMSTGRLSGDGEYTKKCSKLLEELMGCKKILLTTSCTHALEMSAILLDIKEGDEVIVPSFTFVSTANAFALRGAKIVFADVRPDTLNLDERLLPGLITSRTKAVVPVHYGGVGCDMTTIMDLSAKHGFAVVEDNAHGLFATQNGKQLGTFGALATQSFHETKNFQCGEGGALVINDAQLVDRAEVLREKGTNRSKFFKGHVDKYTWVDIGSSYLPSDMLAAFLLAQIENRDFIQNARKTLWMRYYEELGDWAQANGVNLPYIPENCEQPYHVFFMLLPTMAKRDAMLAYLNSLGLLAVFHYIPLHSSPMGLSFGGGAGDCPVTTDVSGRLLRLPFYTNMSAADQTLVIEAVKKFV